MYKSVFPPEKYTWFSKHALNFDRLLNIATRDKAYPVFGNETLAEEFVLLEDHFVGAALCYDQLRNRKENYDIAFRDPVSVMGNIHLKANHAYEHYFISTCGYIDKSLTLIQRYGTLKFPKSMLHQLKQLRLERVAKEHGQEWSFGELKENVKGIPIKGDNYNFEKNMKLLDSIYDYIIDKIKV